MSGIKIPKREKVEIGYYFSGPGCMTNPHNESKKIENCPGYVYTTDEKVIFCCRSGLHSSPTPSGAFEYAYSLDMFKTASWGNINIDYDGKFAARNRLLIWKHNITIELFDFINTYFTGIRRDLLVSYFHQALLLDRYDKESNIIRHCCNTDAIYYIFCAILADGLRERFDEMIRTKVEPLHKKEEEQYLWQ